jgi:hypothetical protein
MVAQLHRWTSGEFRRGFTTPSRLWLPISGGGVALSNPACVTVYPLPTPGREDPEASPAKELPPENRPGVGCVRFGESLREVTGAGGMQQSHEAVPV